MQNAAVMSPDDLATTYRTAERRLRDALFGDGTYAAGLVKGEEARRRVSRELRQMRDAFDAALLEGGEGRADETEARLASLEEELRTIASSRARTTPKPSGGEAPKRQGRRKVTLRDLVLERRFDRTNQRHRRALREDELQLPADDPRGKQLAELAAAYRAAGEDRSLSASLARSFEDVARSG